MKTFRLTGVVTVSAYTEVEAETEAEAIKKAMEREVVLGGFVGAADGTEEWVIDDADGTPQDVTVAGAA